MIEIPEAITISNQMNKALIGKIVKRVEANASPHKFAWFYKDPNDYHRKLVGKKLIGAAAYAGLIEMKVAAATMVFGDGVSLKYYDSSDNTPAKHQLLIEFEDATAMTASIQMYGGIWCYEENEEFDNAYFKLAKQSKSPLAEEFDWLYFSGIIEKVEYQKLSAKAFMATEQRIPGLGNGVLQDILWKAGIHPKRKIKSLKQDEKKLLFNSTKTILAQMTSLGGRDTEKDLYGAYGGYQTKMSKKNIGKCCEVCGGLIHKENYLGGSIYYCEICQKVE